MKKRVLTGVVLLAGLTNIASAASWYFAGTKTMTAAVDMTYSASTGDEFTVQTGITASTVQSPSTSSLSGLTCGKTGTQGQGAAFWLDMEQGAISHISANQQVDLYTQNSAAPGYTSIQSVDGAATAMFALTNTTDGSYSWLYNDDDNGNYDLKIPGGSLYGKCGESWPHKATLLMKKSAVIKPGQHQFSVPLYYRITYDNNVGTSPIHQFATVTTTVTVSNTCNAAVGSLVYSFDKTNMTLPQKKSTSLSVTCDDPDTPLKLRIMAGDGSATQTASDGSVVMTAVDGLGGTMQVSVDHGNSTAINSAQWSNEITASTISGLTSVMSIDPDSKAGTYNQTYQIQISYD